MKSYNHLYEQLISDENISRAIYRSHRNKNNRSKMMNYLYETRNEKETIEKVRKWIINFKNSEHHPLQIYDGISKKVRVIICPSTKEQIVHHAIIQVLEPIIMKGIYAHTYASIPGRGGLKGQKRIKKWIKNDAKHMKYCAKYDIKQYFPSVDHNILKRLMANKIHDKRMLDILYEIVDVVDEGIPLGFYTSQWFANWYLQGLDHYIKEVLKIAHYTRYMDDMSLHDSNKRKLHRATDAIRIYLKDKLHLILKKNYQVFRFDYVIKGKRYGRYLDYMGFQFFRNKTKLRKSIMLHITRIVSKASKQEKITIYNCRRILSMMGWITHTNTYHMFEERISTKINIQNCKRRVSAYDRKIAKQQKNIKEAFAA